MNFGKWIVVALILFAVFIGTLVALCIREDISLVSKDYYKEELAYQTQLQRLNNTEELEQKPVIKLIGHDLQITWADQTKIENGELKLFCPSNAKLDRQFVLQHSNEQVFSTSSLKNGLYKVKLLWTMEGKEYYYEQEIYIA
ncbi:MAG TPA: FixH family protein [Cyclobacteriaceae bacterium]|jgi:hypothetical protein|nr:FixH family protein [Cyclobacteriaceae bacterium]